MDITLDLTESLPTGRNYQSYLQLAPGTKPSAGGNPSSKSGVNFADSGGVIGVSTDNVYYLDGINTTDNATGSFGANINSEIIQEQQVFTGGIPAEYSGGSGLVTRVVTKSGSNEFHGSVNYYLQNDDLVADDDNKPNSTFSTYDTAFTLGGPIIKDKLWFFVSYQEKHREDDVADLNSGELMRTVKDDQELGFAKLTWQPTDEDKFTASFFNDPRDISGSNDASILNNRDQAENQGGDKYKFEYSHAWEDFILTIMAASHEGEASRLAADQSNRNDVAYSGYAASNAELNKGGRGSNRINSRDREELQITLEYFLDTDDYGYHAFKAGYGDITNTNKQNSTLTGSEGDYAQYNSIGAMNSGALLGDYIEADGWVGDIGISADDLLRVQAAMADSADSAYYLGLLDSDSSGDISTAELNALVMNSASGNPTNDVNVYRSLEVQQAPVEMEVKGKEVFIQDNWNYEDFSVNLGFRAEKWEHFSSEGDKIAEFDWEIAPRLSVVYDINGDGESKIFGFAGRYYDPVRSDMTDFAGNLTGPVREEQIFVGDKWLTFRTRGGTATQDAFFSPTTKTPYTDEFMLGYATQLREDISVEVTYTKRITKDIMEDYDLAAYAGGKNGEPAALLGTDYYLPFSYFGYDKNPGSNYVIGTLAGGKREYDGIELSIRKFRVDNWQGGASFTYNDARGNSNSDGNADLQGDFIWLDPRSPGAWGDQPGNIEYLAKAYASYFFENGIEVGAVYNWNSGSLYSKAGNVYGRQVPVRVDDAYEDGGYTTRWMEEGYLGSETTDSYGTLDVRVKYVHEFEHVKAEVFMDIFNVLDDQAGITQQALVAGDGDYAFGEDTSWVKPRRFYLGAKISF